MQRILMVCLGNICRSPLAEGILRQKIGELGITTIEVDSAGTSDYHTGDAPDQRSSENALKNGVDIRMLRARQFTAGDFDRFDRIYVMDASNYRNVINLARDESDHAKVDFILNVAWPGENRAVPDPYYGGEQGFEQVFRLLEKACTSIAENLQDRS
ncbi:MAG: protein-tyrosine phosphatase [Bacteroidetes bacterium]|nr:MAG: protein-tyrosine phosphatase [Bacteroidota bacterium]